MVKNIILDLPHMPSNKDTNNQVLPLVRSMCNQDPTRKCSNFNKTSQLDWVIMHLKITYNKTITILNSSTTMIVETITATLTKVLVTSKESLQCHLIISIIETMPEMIITQRTLIYITHHSNMKEMVHLHFQMLDLNRDLTIIITTIHKILLTSTYRMMVLSP